MFKAFIIGFIAVGASFAQTSPAERAIASTTTLVTRTPGDAGAHSRLAMAYARRARETADPQFYALAMESVGQALDLSPNSYEALRAKAWTLLGMHEFSQAAAVAESLNKRAPDDVIVYGLMADAYVELGRYDEAVEATQWMLDLRPGNIPGLTRAAYIRELHGWIEGSIDMMRQAYDRTPYSETENRAWIQVHLGHLERSRGNFAAAQAHIDMALDQFPGYHYALAELGRLRTAQQLHEEAAKAYEARYAAAAHPENLFDWAEALLHAGRTEEANEMFGRFETAAVAESHSWDNANRELIAYYVEHADLPLDALKIARRDFERRKDVFTRASYAWALYHAGEADEAQKQMEQVLSRGVIDARITRYAAVMNTTQPEKRWAYVR